MGRMERLLVKTRQKRQVLDLTAAIETRLQANGARHGLCFLFLTHTTAALTTADLDPGTDLDMLDAFEVLVPKLRYRHPHDPAHVPDHILSSLIGTSLVVPCEGGKLILGTWQRIVLVEFNGPRECSVVLTVTSEIEP